MLFADDIMSIPGTRVEETTTTNHNENKQEAKPKENKTTAAKPPQKPKPGKTWIKDLFGGIKTYLEDATSEDEDDDINNEDD